VRAHFLSGYLVGVTLFNHFIAIFKDGGPELTDLHYFFGYRKPE
jgi:hypothetical protein